ALTRYKEVVHKADLELAGRATALDPSLEASFETLRGNLLRHLEKLEKKITSSLKRRGGELVSRIARLQTLVYPRQSPQERLFSLLSFLPRYGFGIIDTLLDGLAVPSWEHQIIILDYPWT
ncbi:bacillithiol biosynthesis BshC, partial [bacterium]|nr:bacillithiol biosynthesis BshC [bacterium]